MVALRLEICFGFLEEIIGNVDFARQGNELVGDDEIKLFVEHVLFLNGAIDKLAVAAHT